MKLKKLLFLSLAILACFGLVACQNKETPNQPSNDDMENQQTINETTSTIMETLSQNATVIVNMPMTDAIPAEQALTFVGLSQEEFEANIIDSVYYESMISPATESYCLVKAKDGADIAALKQTIFDNCNPRKWVCTSASRVVVINSGNYILLAMGANESCDSMVAEFKTYFNNDVGEALDKTVDDGSSEPIEDVSPELIEDVTPDEGSLVE